MDPQYARRYRDLYERHWWWRAREEAVLQVLRRHNKTGPQLRILDVGCGDGLFFDRLAEFGMVDGIEPDEALISPQGTHRARITIAPFDKNFRPREPYSLVLMLDVLEHLDHPDEALEHAYTLLGPSGALLLTVPAFQSLWTNHDTINHHRVRYRCGTLNPLLQRAGFKTLDERYWFQWTCPIKLGIRVYERIFKRPPTAARVPPVWINRPLFWLSRAEQRTLGIIGMPFGSSLMVYCVKQEAFSHTHE